MLLLMFLLVLLLLLFKIFVCEKKTATVQHQQLMLNMMRMIWFHCHDLGHFEYAAICINLINLVCEFQVHSHIFRIVLNLYL